MSEENGDIIKKVSNAIEMNVLKAVFNRHQRLVKAQHRLVTKLDERKSKAKLTNGVKANEPQKKDVKPFEQDVEMAENMMKKLIEEENRVKSDRSLNQKVKNTKKNKRIVKKIETNNASNNSKKAVSLNSKVDELKESISFQNPDKSISKQESLSKLAANLSKKSFKRIEHARVQRWKTEDLNNIRSFEDFRGDERIFHYQHMTDDEIVEQRFRHYLPGTERLLKEPYRSIYSIETKRGFLMKCRLSYDGITQYGILCITLSKTHFVFHKYFEDAALTESEKSLFEHAKDVQKIEKEKTGEDWLSEVGFNSDISEEGIFHFQYPEGHELWVQPVNKDLFEQELAKLS